MNLDQKALEAARAKVESLLGDLTGALRESYIEVAQAHTVAYLSSLPMHKPTKARLRELFEHDDDAGVLIWRRRPAEDFATVRGWKRWTTRHAGKVAGGFDWEGYWQIQIGAGGREEGFRVGFINYPRFPKEPSDIIARAHDLARVLRVHLGQQSYSIVTPVETTWVSTRPENEGSAA